MRLEELMLRKGYSIKALAREAKVSPGTVHGLVRGADRETRPTIMKKIADTLGVKIDEVDEFNEIIQERLGKDLLAATVISDASRQSKIAAMDQIAAISTV